MPDTTSSSNSLDRGALPREPRHGLWASVGAIGAAFLASLCCIGPVLFVTIGVGAGLASTFEPLRPVFSALTVGMLIAGFYVVYRKQPAAACAPDGSCPKPKSRVRDKVLLWSATGIAVLLLTFPEWSRLLL
jgi:mercuric ion transport protein